MITKIILEAMAILKNDIININGIVIGTQDIKELDKVVEILSDKLGRIKVFAFSARSQKSSNIAKTRLFCAGKFEITKSKDNYTLVSADIENYYDDLIMDYDKVLYASNFIKLIKSITYENMDCTNELALLCYSLNGLLNPEINDEVVSKVFEVKLAQISGIGENADAISDKLGLNTQNKQNITKLINHIYTMPINKLYSFNLSGALYDDFLKISINLNDIT